jgi:transcription elongation factor
MFDKFQEVEVKLDDKIIIKFREIMNNKGELSTFILIIEKLELNTSGELIVQKTTKKVSFLTKVKRDLENSKNYINITIEEKKIYNICCKLIKFLHFSNEKLSYALISYTTIQFEGDILEV